MKWHSSLLCLVIVASATLAQTPPQIVGNPPGGADNSFNTEVPIHSDDYPLIWDGDDPAVNQRSLLSGNHNFPNFIGFLSNPLQSIDPRPMTAIWPLFSSTWVSEAGPIPDGDIQLYGAGLYVALSERFSFGLNQGGYAAANFDVDTMGAGGANRGGHREGWLNLGGFLQYLLIEDVPDQFLLTTGLRWEAPAGSKAIFQGRGPAYLAPYVTIGKEFGQCHLLVTSGYEFPAGSADVTSNYFYGNVHLDRQICGWLYPLVELNWTYHTTSAEGELPTRRGFVDLGNFSSTGNILSVAIGANTVIIPSKLELGAVYTRSLATQRNFDFDGVLLKMLYRY